MANETQLETVQRLLLPMLADDIFLVEMKVKPTNNIKIFLDADGGLGIEKCIRINRRLYKIMDEMGVYPDGNFSLEVSSPGIGESLKMHRQYMKNIGRLVEVTLQDETTLEGTLTVVTEEQITITFTEGKGKKALDIVKEIPFTEIKETKVQIKF